MSEPFYPKVLICSLIRINQNDNFNNSLLLKNLFVSWPKENLAQIYSGGGNDMEGFCGQQYHIAARDRRFGKIFFKWKREYADSLLTFSPVKPAGISEQRVDRREQVNQAAGRFVMTSGLYELLFKIRPSRQLIDWAKSFDPDIVLAQGYNLSFIWLPLILKKELKKPLAYFCSDDWPSYLYTLHDGMYGFTMPVLHRIVTKLSKRLFAATEVPFAFSHAMGHEYEQRYGKSFTILMHSDDLQRFERAEPMRVQPPGVRSIIATGAFDSTRWPLLLDLEAACQQLNQEGIRVQATVLVSRMSEEGYCRLGTCRHVELRADPGHDILPSYLKGADLLFLPETFDPIVAHGYRYSISTKAHLFMFSHQPILVYGHPENGLLQYASQEGWAEVLAERTPEKLKNALRRLLTDRNYCSRLVSRSDAVVRQNHDRTRNQNVFWQRLFSAVDPKRAHFHDHG